jgi:hypothetical protein
MDDSCCEEYATNFSVLKICVLYNGLEAVRLTDAIPEFKYCPWCGKVKKEKE